MLRLFGFMLPGPNKGSARGLSARQAAADVHHGLNIKRATSRLGVCEKAYQQAEAHDRPPDVIEAIDAAVIRTMQELFASRSESSRHRRLQLSRPSSEAERPPELPLGLGTSLDDDADKPD